MLVDISFTVSLDEIPKRLSDLFIEDIQGKYLKGIGMQLAEIETMLATSNISENITDKIDLLRRNLAFADMRLKNISVITEGYIKIREDQYKQEQSGELADPHSLDDFSDEIQEIAKKLQFTKGELKHENG